MSPVVSAATVMVVGIGLSHHLPWTYLHAFEDLGWRGEVWDLDRAVRQNARLGRLGRTFSDFVPVEAWVRKGNRELLLRALELRPDVLLTVGHAATRVGALAQLRAALPATKLALVWPDTLLNLDRDELECLPLYDFVACYGRDAVEPMRRLGARAIEWVPLAADLHLHAPPAALTEAEVRRYGCDVLFIGNHRPEREASILRLLDAGFRVRVWGSAGWKKHARNVGRVHEFWEGGELTGGDFARAAAAARICLNLIDPMNFPSANMRYFENFLSGSATVNSRCPELEDVFRDREHTLYFDDDAALVGCVRELLEDAPLAARLGAAGREALLSSHTYRHRAEQIARALGR